MLDSQAILFLGQLSDPPVDRWEPFDPDSKRPTGGAAFSAGDDPQSLFAGVGHDAETQARMRLRK